ASLTVTMFTFTDDPLTAQSMRITAAHFMELRAAIDSLRAAHGLTTFAWTDPTLTPGSTMVKVVHLVDLRTALTQAYVSAGRTPPTYSDSSVVGGATIIKAIHLSELRIAVGALECGPRPPVRSCNLVIFWKPCRAFDTSLSDSTPTYWVRRWNLTHL